MQVLDGRYVYSATDLNNYLECGHLVARERAVALGEADRPEKDPTVELIALKGLEHERHYLELLRERRPGLVEIDGNTLGTAAIERAAADTIRAMAGGAAAIYQATFYDGTFLGKADFLLRVERPSALWAWSYEVADTKLALQNKPYFIIQLSHYSEHIARVQGTTPEFMHVVLGNGTPRSFRVDDFAAYYRHLKASFLERGAASDVYPLPVPHCDICSWSGECGKRRRADDHLTLVAGMRRDQAARFEEAGIATLAALAPDGVMRPQGMQESTFERLHRQASLQLRGRESHRDLYELLDHPPAAGFGLMPAPAEGDVFFDMEGDPFFEIGVGLEYLFGFYCPDEARKFIPFWGTDRAGEKAAFEAAIDFLVERRKRYPSMHAYHYAAYEKTALRKLSQRHDTREEEVDDLLRSEVLVDLYAVVRQTLAISQESYSIKKLEPFYGMVRSADVRKGDDSVVRFETWLRERERLDILRDIERYNEEDCDSTWRLREWLLERRAEYARSRGIEVAFRPLRGPGELCHDAIEPGCKKCAQRERDERERKKVSEHQRLLADSVDDSKAHLLGHLLAYHRREEKPVWWKLFDRCDNVDHLLEFDREAIGGLKLCSEIEPVKHRPGDRNLVYTYTFPDQLHAVGNHPIDPANKKAAGEIVELDEDRNTLRIKRGGDRKAAALLTALVPPGPVVSDAQKQALARVAAAYLVATFEREHPAAFDILAGVPPRLRDRPRGARIQPDVVTPESVLEVVRALDGSYLFVQGPPGTGKTYTGARVIAELLRSGKRVGVMAGGHKAIHNMLHAIEAYAAATGLSAREVRGLHKHSDGNDGSRYETKLPEALIGSTNANEPLESGEYNLVSGTAWLFARPAMTAQLDYLFIDEAGQTSLADAIAVAPSARNVVLLGDPMQLAQVSQGSHPGNAGRSVLEHLLGEAETVREHRGILLDTSYRMEPAICRFISQTSYEGRLRAYPPTNNNRVRSVVLSGGGLRFVPVEHAGNGRESIEEAQRIGREIDALLRGTYVRQNEDEAPLTQRDIMVVTPYNAQRKRIEAVLAAAGHPDVRVGTVDKFQGQEAPVVFYSMATSSGDDLPRNMEFLFEKNRFNVAVSRAQCLAVVVCSPTLLDVRCNSAEQIALVNIVCRYVEEAARPAP
jgi:predicted RecB family nuclease